MACIWLGRAKGWARRQRPHTEGSEEERASPGKEHLQSSIHLPKGLLSLLEKVVDERLAKVVVLLVHL